MKKLIAISLMAACLGGCSTWDNMGKTEKGAIIGAGGGAVIGSMVGGKKGAVVGGVGGAVGGGVVGHKMDKDDEKAAEE